jgi:hypothetical protein
MMRSRESEAILPPNRLSRLAVLGVLALGAASGCTSDSDRAGEFTITGNVLKTEDGQVEIDVTEIAATDYTSERLVNVNQYVKVQDGYVWDRESCESHQTGRVENPADEQILETDLVAGQTVEVEGFVHAHVSDCGISTGGSSYSSQLVYESIQVLPS